jgi:hypothetical protein
MVVTHGGTSQFINSGYETFNFTHAPFVDTSLRFESQTPGCTRTSRSQCPVPQCANTFNLSPYGLWTLQFAPSWFGSGGAAAVDGIVMQLHVEYVPVNPPPGPEGFKLFEGPDEVEMEIAPC